MRTNRLLIWWRWKQEKVFFFSPRVKPDDSDSGTLLLSSSIVWSSQVHISLNNFICKLIFWCVALQSVLEVVFLMCILSILGFLSFYISHRKKSNESTKNHHRPSGVWHCDSLKAWRKRRKKTINKWGPSSPLNNEKNWQMHCKTSEAGSGLESNWKTNSIGRLQFAPAREWGKKYFFKKCHSLQEEKK